MRGPGVKPPPKEKANSPTPPRKEITLNIDIAPTMLGFAGLSPPKSMDGLNMAGESRVFTNKLHRGSKLVAAVFRRYLDF